MIKIAHAFSRKNDSSVRKNDSSVRKNDSSVFNMFIPNSLVKRSKRVLQMSRDDCSLKARRPKACSDNSGARAMH